MIHELTLSDSTIPAQGPYAKLFDEFNLVQSTLLKEGVPDEDANLVLGTATSTGKTISAEFFVYTTLAKRRTVVYAAPMRALATEKYEEWKDRFPGKRVVIITGDFKENNKNEKIQNADIIILTNEMLDVKTRGLRDEDHWLRRVGLLIVDEAHIMGSESRGAAAEAGIIRLTQFVKKARIVLLSATIPNSKDFVEWLHRLNDKPTYTLNTSWRPVPLEWRISQIPTFKNYGERIFNTIDECVRIVQESLPQKCLCFVHEKKTGEKLEARFKKLGISAPFHSADKSAANRKKFENDFGDRSEESMKVLISTSTLAWGVSLPARNVIICGTQRGISAVEESDIIQMAGRSGRLGIDDKGTCHLLADSAHKWKKKIAKQSPVLSQMAEEGALEFQLLAEVYLRVIKTIEDLQVWYRRTLTSSQDKDSEQQFLQAVADLKKYGMIVANDDNELFATPLGKISTRSYFRPGDVHFWRSFLANADINNKPLDDIAISLLVGMSPSIGMEYVPRQYQGNVDGYISKAKRAGYAIPTTGTSCFIAWAIYEQLRGEAGSKGVGFYVRSIISDSDRICGTITGLCELDKLELKVGSLLPRLKYGVPERLAELCEIPNVGAKRAFLLWKNKIQSREDLLTAGQEKIGKIVGPLISRKIFEGIA